MSTTITRAMKNVMEYIVVHEMTHHLERNHGQRFTTLMDNHMPNWRARRDQLNAGPLASERWAKP